MDFFCPTYSRLLTIRYTHPFSVFSNLGIIQPLSIFIYTIFITIIFQVRNYWIYGSSFNLLNQQLHVLFYIYHYLQFASLDTVLLISFCTMIQCTCSVLCDHESLNFLEGILYYFCLKDKGVLVCVWKPMLCHNSRFLYELWAPL